MAQELFSLLWPRCLEKYNSFFFHFCLWKLGSIWKVVLTLLLIDLEFYGLPHQCPQVLIVYLEVSLFWPIPSGFNLLSLDSVLIVFSSVASLSFEKGIFVEYHWDSCRLRLLHCCMRFWVLSDCLQLFLLVCSLEFV